MNLKGKIAVVTGATGGLGFRICHALGAEGVKLVMVYNKSKDKAEANLKELKALGYEGRIVQADVTNQTGIDAMIGAAVETYGGLDLLVLDAAYNKWIPFSDVQALDAENWNYILNFNLTSPYLAARTAAPLMKKRGAGRIVTISSIGGLHPQASSIAYAVSKAALQHLSRCLAVALGPEILVNDIAPGLMEGTLMTNNLSPEYARKARETTLLKRAANKEDVAEAVLLMCKTDSITGQTLVVDAGKVFH